MKIALHDFHQDRSYTRPELDSLVGAAAARLREHLPQPAGVRVAALSRNGVELLALMLACFRVGAVFVPLNWRLTPRELDQLLADCQAGLIYTQEEFRPHLSHVQVPCLSLDAGFGAALEGTVSEAPGPDGQLAMLLYTSGTSGRPKGVMLTLGNLRVASENFRAVADVRPESGMLCDAPMFHTIGLVAICYTSVSVGARLYLSPAFTPTDTVDRIADPRHAITHYFSVPQVMQMLLQASNFTAEKFRGLRALFTGGAPLPHDVLLAWLGHDVTLINGYGSSEAGTCIHMPLDHPAQLRSKPGSVGLPVPHLQVSLRDLEGRAVAPGGVGEIWLRGPSVTAGYWGLEAETAQAFTDGWFRSGDAARVDEDGYYYLVDRWKDMYISGGENVYPAEVEQVIARIEGVAEVAVVGQPDATWGEIGEAFVVLKPGALLDAGQVIANAKQNLAGYKVPKRVIFTESLPRTGSGKIRKSELRRR
jgi:fatty-acyl-CoA synthase